MTEYNFGAGTHISGGLAELDVLGALGREGVYLATYWGNGAGKANLRVLFAVGSPRHSRLTPSFDFASVGPL